ncbi:hypothetical protein ACJA3S_22605 [Pseudomonas sp. KnCO4]|uniref:hypothetical protein n=1 Tax=Pseudomonas sp. KnCO4 TaxID=3381355 RepID=UPI00387799E5
MQEFTKPELLRLQLHPKVKKKPLDIGSFAYFIRGKNESVWDDRGTPVVMQSFVEGRRELITKILESFVGLRDRSVLAKFHNAECVLDWLSANGYREIFANAPDAQRAYRDYTAYLNNKVADRAIRPITAESYQKSLIDIIQLIYPETFHHILAGGIRIIGRRGTIAVSTAHFELYRDVCLAIAKQVSDCILSNKPFPFVISIRDYEVVIFPSNRGAIGPFNQSPFSYNAAERRIATVEEYVASRDQLRMRRVGRSSAIQNLKETRNSLMLANQDQRHWYRFEMAGLAAKAYLCLFLMITAATPTELAQFTHVDALEVQKSPLKKELSAVKFRAGGKATLYNVGRYSGLSILQDYLKLRDWILNGVPCDPLFFRMPRSEARSDLGYSYEELDVTSAINKFHNTISGVFLDPEVPRLSPRQIRKAKSGGMHTARVAPGTVASVLHHSEAVNLSTYAEAGPEQQEAEISAFWQVIHHAAEVVRDRSEKAAGGEIATATGHCDSFNQPNPFPDQGIAAIEPNCRSQYGCLYCEHYIIHSDEQDLHKLISLQYVINAVRKLAPDAGHAEVLYRDLSIRIEFLLETLGSQSEVVKQTIAKVKIDVFEYGVLTSFWERRLIRYEKMGVVF